MIPQTPWWRMRQLRAVCTAPWMGDSPGMPAECTKTWRPLSWTLPTSHLAAGRRRFFLYLARRRRSVGTVE